MQALLVWQDNREGDEDINNGPVILVSTMETTTIVYDYDPLYRLTEAVYSGAITATYSYVYDSVGSMTAYTETVGVETTIVTRTFDAANRLVTSKHDEETTNYIYNNNGNLAAVIVLSDPVIVHGYAYDQRNLLLHVTRQTGMGPTRPVVDYIYDGAGNRLRQIDYGGSQPVTTTYTNDNSGLSQVLVSDDGATQTYNLFGLSLLYQDDGDETRTLLADGLGSVRLEMVGNAVDSATTYEPYGNLLVQTGPSGTVYGFTGEQHDAATNLLYLRARYYSPALRVFMSVDKHPGNARRPSTLHKYNYVSGNPVNKRDPSGLCEQYLPDEACWSLAERLASAGVGSLTHLGSMNYSELSSFRFQGLIDHEQISVDMAERDSINVLAPYAFEAAQRHNRPYSNMDTNSFAALILTILHIEGKLPGNQKPVNAYEIAHDAGADYFQLLFGHSRPRYIGGHRVGDNSTGISNVRPSVGAQILRGEIPGPDGSLMPGNWRYCVSSPQEYHVLFRYLETGHMSLENLVITQLQDPRMGVEYLAANLARGVDRVTALGHQPSVFNLGAWHKGGIQHPGLDGYASRPHGLEAATYGYVALQSLPQMFVFVAEVPGARQGGYYLPYNQDEAQIIQNFQRR